MAAKEVPTNEPELESLMSDLEEMLAKAEASPPPAPAPQPAPVAPTPPVAETPPWEPEKTEPVPAAAPTVAPTPVAASGVLIEPPVAATDPEEADDVIVPDEPSSAGPAPAAAPVPSVYRAPVGSNGSMSHYIDVEKFQADTLVCETNLDQAMMEQSGMRAFYGAQAAYAEAQVSRTKAKFEIIEAKLFDHHRKELAKTAEKVTEKMVESAVKMDPRWLAAKNAVIEAQTIADVNKGLTFALADRRDMLIQLGADRREEFKGQVRIVDQQQGHKSLTDRALAAVRNARGAA